MADIWQTSTDDSPNLTNSSLSASDPVLRPIMISFPSQRDGESSSSIMALSMANPVAIGLLLMVIWTLQKLSYALVFSPLRKIPGPFLARLSPLYLRIIDMSGNRTRTIHNLHRQYGSTVLIGPQEISVSDIENVKDIYGQHTNFIKAPVYESLSMPPIGVFSMRDKTQHSKRRRLLSHAFSQSNLLDSEQLIQTQISRLIEVIRSSGGEPLDMLKLFRLAAFDIVGELFLGQPFGGLATGTPPQFLTDMDMYFILSDVKWNNPWIAKFLSYLPSSRVQYFLGAIERLAQYGSDAFQLYINQYGRSSGRRDLLTKILSAKAETGEAQLSDRETSIEIGNLIFAGTDTTSTTLTYLFWELSRHPQWQDRLREEIKANTDATPTFLQVMDLPILDAVITEALRLHPAAPASLPRELPHEGRELNGYFIPKNTVVSMQCYTTHRDPAVYPDPERFHPQRWMDSQNVSQEMKEMFMPFSKGTRACLGKNLAMIELKIITAIIVKSFEVSPAPGTTEQTMAMTDHFLLIPAAGKCDLIFKEKSAVKA